MLADETVDQPSSCLSPREWHELMAASTARRRRQAAKVDLDQAGKRDCPALVEEAADDLQTDWQAVFGPGDRHRRRRHPVQRGEPGPHALDEVVHLGAVDIENAGKL